MGTLVTAVQAAYDTYKASKNVTSMNESELTEYNLTCLKFDTNLEKATAIETAFYAARDEAFAAYESQYQTGRAALATTWQGFENNNFTVA